MTVLVIERDEDGRPMAAGESALAAFLNADVRFADQAEDLATEAARGGPADLTGNAYAVTIGADGVVLTHLHLPDRPATLLSRDDFAAALRNWAAALRAGQA